MARHTPKRAFERRIRDTSRPRKKVRLLQALRAVGDAAVPWLIELLGEEQLLSGRSGACWCGSSRRDKRGHRAEDQRRRDR